MERSVFYTSFTHILLILAFIGFIILLFSNSSNITADANRDITNKGLVTNNKSILFDSIFEIKNTQDYKPQDYNEYYKNINPNTKDKLMKSISYYENPATYSKIFLSNMEPYNYIYEANKEYVDSRGHGDFALDLLTEKFYFQIYLYGMSYVEGDDVEIIQIRILNQNDYGLPILSLCNEIKGKGHCREGPGLSVEGYLEKKDLIGPLKNYSFDDLFYVLQAGQAYVYVQSKDYPEGELIGQILGNYQ